MIGVQAEVPLIATNVYRATFKKSFDNESDRNNKRQGWNVLKKKLFKNKMSKVFRQN